MLRSRFTFALALAAFVLPHVAQAQIEIDAAGNVLVGTATQPGAVLTVGSADSTTTASIVHGLRTGARYGSQENAGLRSEGQGGNAAIGVYGWARQGTSGTIGLFGHAENSGGHSTGIYGRGLDGATANYGVHGLAGGNNTAAKYGIYGNTWGQGPRYAGYFVGNVTVTGTLTQLSDRRFKRDIEALDGAEVLARVMRLRPQRYRYSDADRERFGLAEGVHYGFLAQDVQAVFPELVSEIRHAAPGDEEARGETETYLGVSYSELVPLLLMAIQEQQREIESLRRETIRR